MPGRAEVDMGMGMDMAIGLLMFMPRFCIEWRFAMLGLLGLFVEGEGCMPRFICGDIISGIPPGNGFIPFMPFMPCMPFIPFMPFIPCMPFMPLRNPMFMFIIIGFIIGFIIIGFIIGGIPGKFCMPGRKDMFIPDRPILLFMLLDGRDRGVDEDFMGVPEVIGSEALGSTMMTPL